MTGYRKLILAALGLIALVILGWVGGLADQAIEAVIWVVGLFASGNAAEHAAREFGRRPTPRDEEDS